MDSNPRGLPHGVLRYAGCERRMTSQVAVSNDVAVAEAGSIRAPPCHLPCHEPVRPDPCAVLTSGPPRPPICSKLCCGSPRPRSGDDLAASDNFGGQASSGAAGRVLLEATAKLGTRRTWMRFC
jgi:hypothetical protein